MSSWFVYILRCADDTLYCGVTTNIDRRINEHNRGTAAKYTRARTPVKLETYVETGGRSEALKLEIKVKKKARCEKIDYLNSFHK